MVEAAQRVYGFGAEMVQLSFSPPKDGAGQANAFRYATGMSMPSPLFDRLRLPLIGSPLFIVSGPELVIAQCKAGIVGSFPALNARPQAQLDEWLHQITEELSAWNRDNPDTPAAPYAVNQIVHKSNDRLDADLSTCAKWQVPLTITSLGAREDLNKAVHAWGGITFHDVIDDRFSRKAIEKGADGLIPVATGAGGHAGTLSPFAFVQELRTWFDGPIALSGAIACGKSILGAQAIGADLAYMGSPFIATAEANATQGYKDGIVEGKASDIVYSNLFTGVHGNYLRGSIIAAGMDPDNLPEGDLKTMNFGSGGNTEAKAWKDIWGSGQGVGAITEVLPVGAFVDRLEAEYHAARAELAAKTAPYKSWR
jgi:nitronate monooxygenase